MVNYYLKKIILIKYNKKIHIERCNFDNNNTTSNLNIIITIAALLSIPITMKSIMKIIIELTTARIKSNDKRDNKNNRHANTTNINN